MAGDGPLGEPISISGAIDALTFLPDRTRTMSGEESARAFANVSAYRDGAIFVGHWAGHSQWERHPVGDEVVMVLDGETTLFLLGSDGEEQHSMRAHDLLVVPQDTWHRFETPVGVKVMTVTPQPTEHRLDLPSD